MFASTTWRAPLGCALFTSLLAVAGQALVHGQQPAASDQAVPPAAPAAAAGPDSALTLTFDQAIDRVAGTSENITIAAADLARADAGVRQAHSARLPQLIGAASYDRTLKSEFSGLFDSTGPPCTPLQADPTAPLEDRVTELERAYGCPSGDFSAAGAPAATTRLPFGQANVYRLGLSFSQALYAGGRIAASEEQARLRRDSASLGVTSARAQATLDVAQAYYDAALADRLVSIAEQTYNQADQALQQATAQRDAGRLSEFEQLRARVARDTLQPDVVRSTGEPRRRLPASQAAARVSRAAAAVAGRGPGRFGAAGAGALCKPARQPRGAGRRAGAHRGHTGALRMSAWQRRASARRLVSVAPRCRSDRTTGSCRIPETSRRSTTGARTGRSAWASRCRS